MKRLSARNKLLITLSALLMTAFVGVSVLNYRLTRESIRQEILSDNLPLTMDNIYSELTSDLTRPLLVSSSMATDTFLKDWVLGGENDTGKIIRYLDQIKERYGFFTTFFVSSTTGIYYRYTGINKKISQKDAHDIWYFDFLASGKEYDFDVDTDEAANNILTVFINYKVFDREGKVLGVTGVGLKVNNLARRISAYRKKYDRLVYLTDTKGVIQVHPDTTLIEKKSIADLGIMADLREKVLNKANDSANFEFDRNGNEILLTVRYIPSLDWFLYVEQNETKALAIARKNFIHTILIGFFVSVVIISLTLVTLNRYQDRLELLVKLDELTGIANRRALEEEFQKFLYASSRSDRLFSLIIIDLDGFKKVNDVHGHIIGDHLLVDVVDLIRGNVRPTDIFARWGGDEFVILSDNTSEEAGKLAERIRQSVRNAQLGGPEEINIDDPRNQVTVSIGISVYNKDEDLAAMLLRADQAMYRCKTKGGDCIESAL